MPASPSRFPRQLAVVLAFLLAVAGLVAIAPTAAVAAQTGAATDATLTWGVSDVTRIKYNGLASLYPDEINEGATCADANAAAAQGQQICTAVNFDEGTGSTNASGQTTLSYEGTITAWATTGNQWIALKDPELTFDNSGVGQVVAGVEFGTTTGSLWATKATKSPGGVLTRIKILDLVADPNPTAGDGIRDDYPYGSQTFSKSVASGVTTFANLRGLWTTDFTTHLNGPDGVQDTQAPGASSDGFVYVTAFQNAITGTSPNTRNRYATPMTATAKITTAATTATAASDGDGIVITVSGTGFRKTAPGLYVSLRTRTAGDAPYNGGSLDQSTTPTAWVSNDPADLGPDPETGAAAVIGDDGSFTVPLRLTEAHIDALDAGGTYTIVTRKAHGQGTNPIHTDQITEVAAPSNLGALLAAAQEDDGSPGAFTGVSPARILDTRNGTGATKAQVRANKALTFQVTGRGGIPASGASAVALNVTATKGSKSGYVSAYPAGVSRPGTSNLTHGANQTIATHVTVKLGTDGKVTLFNGSTAPIDLIADALGWYSEGTVTDAGMFTPIVPARLASSQAVGKTGSATVAVTNRAGIPASGVGAGAFNLTAGAATEPGFITAYPNGTSRPSASNVNLVIGKAAANAATTKLGSDGKLALYNGSAATARVSTDVAGWFSDGTPSEAGSFTSVIPGRILDTRSGLGAAKAQVGANKSITIDVAGQKGVPVSGAGSAVLNVTVTRTGAPGFVTAYPAGTSRPGASNVNFGAVNQTIPNLVTVKLGAGKVTLYNSSTKPVDILADVAGWYRE